MPLFRRDENEDDDGWGTAEESPTPEQGTDADAEAGDDEGSDPVRLHHATIQDDDPHGTLKRTIDHEAGVVIYAYKNQNAGGLAAVPLSETELVERE